MNVGAAHRCQRTLPTSTMIGVRHTVAPDETNPIMVTHGLGTEDVEVVCETHTGDHTGYLAAIPIDANRVEVVAVPGTDIAVVEVTANGD